MTKPFRDREEAGARLAERLTALELPNPAVLALPRGGVPVAFPVAKALSAPLDLVMVRKIGAPGQEELAAGAVVDGAEPETVFNDGILAAMGLGPRDLDETIRRELAEIERRRAAYLGTRPPVPLKGKDIVVVDDGIATGATMRAALKALSRKGAASVTLVVPVAPRDALDEVEPLVDRTICLETPTPFIAVGAHYLRFDQTSDAEVIRLLREAEAWTETTKDKGT